MNSNEAIKIISPKTPEQKQAILSRIWFVLNRQGKMSLSYVNERGEPVQSFMLYAVDDDFNFYMGTLRRFHKYEFLIQNPIISILVIDELPDAKHVITARAHITDTIDNPNDIKKVMRWFTMKNSCRYFIKPFSDFVFFKATPLSIRMIDSTGDILTRYDITME